jgi:hypothetical protein
MEMLDKYVRTVKGQLTYFDAQIRRWSRTPDHPSFDPRKLDKYNRLADDFQDLLEYLLQQRRIERSAPTNFEQEPPPEVAQDDVESEAGSQLNSEPEFSDVPSEPGASRSPNDRDDDDLSDLPPELLKELSDSFKGETDPLIAIINDRGGTASIDEILVDLYRKYGEIGKRPIISNKLYRFSRRGLCAAMPGKKGIYTTDPALVHAGGEEEEEESEEGPDAETSEPSSNHMGVASSPGSPSKAIPVGASPTTSTIRRRELFASAAIPSVRVPQ